MDSLSVSLQSEENVKDLPQVTQQIGSKHEN